MEEELPELDAATTASNASENPMESVDWS
jgi:hypothetical protein